MSKRSRRNLEILRRRATVAELYLAGKLQHSIANELGVAQSTVSADLRAIRRQWKQSAIRDFDAARGEELERLRRVEKEAWEAWQRSQQPQQSAVIQGPGNDAAKKTISNRDGDPRFLDVVLRCVSARRSILGLDAPSKIAPVTPDGKPLTFDQRQVHINAILAERFGVTSLLEAPQTIDSPPSSPSPSQGSDHDERHERHDGRRDSQAAR